MTDAPQIWITSFQLAKLFECANRSARRILKNAKFQNHVLATREAYGNRGKCCEVLLSSLPVEIQERYFQNQAQGESHASHINPNQPPPLNPSKNQEGSTNKSLKRSPFK